MAAAITPRESSSLKIGSSDVVPVYHNSEVTPDQAAACLRDSKVIRWADAVSKNNGKAFTVKGIKLQPPVMFGPRPGFIHLVADIDMANGKKGSGAMMLRGDAVALLPVIKVILRDPTKVFFSPIKTLVVKQPRFPIGEASYTELMAGMTDGSGDFVGVMFKEAMDELGLQKPINIKDVVPLTDLYTEGGAMVPSAGGCDEKIKIYAWVTTMYQDELDEFEGKHTGCYEEGEFIAVHTMDLADIWKLSDGKALAAKALWDHHERVTLRASVINGRG